MPAMYTHYEFGKKVYQELNNKDLQDSIKKNLVYYNIFNQGWDNLFYSPYKWKYYREFATKSQKYNCILFFQNMLNYIKDNNLENNIYIYNILYGFLNHYILDNIMHPYINANVKLLNTSHAQIEFSLDNYISKNKEKRLKEVNPKIKFNNDTKKLIEYVFDKTYNKKNIGNIYEKSHNISSLLYRLFVFDKTGIKTFIYSVIDMIMPKKEFKLKDYSYHIKFNDKLLNKDKNKWHNPRNKEEVYNYSFSELYDIAIKIAIKTNLIAYKVLNNDYNIDDFINYLDTINIKNIQVLLEK